MAPITKKKPSRSQGSNSFLFKEILPSPAQASICGFASAGLHVGPRSAGAHPGPACYGVGGPLTISPLDVDQIVPPPFRYERDEGEREPPCEQYPWDGVSGVRPFRELSATTTVGVY